MSLVVQIWLESGPQGCPVFLQLHSTCKKCGKVNWDAKQHTKTETGAPPIIPSH